MESTDNFAYLLPFIFMVFGCTFLFFGRKYSVSAPYWGVGYVSAAAGFCTPLILAAIPVPAQAIISNAFFLLAFFCYGQALCRRFEVGGYLAARLVFCALVMVALGYLIFLHHDLRTELAISDIACASLIAAPLFAVRKKLNRAIDKLLGVVVGLVIFDCLSRVTGMLALTSSDAYQSLDEFFASDYAFYMQLNASIFGFLMALTVLGTIMLDVVGQHRHAAEHDPMTEAFNRRGFERAIPDFTPNTFPAGAVLVCDIDHFKLVNDRFGHAAGDAVIVGLAATLRGGLPADSVVARFGGEEFVAFLPGTSLAEAGILANAMRLTFAAKDWREAGVSQQITASFGISSTAIGDHSMHDAIGRADACLYAAKAAGRNQVIVEGGHSQDVPPSIRLVAGKKA